VIRPPGESVEDPGTVVPTTSAEIGQTLRASREQQGVALSTVHDRLARPVTELDALERGDLASLPDQALALSTLRRYANFLGLDGDALALRMLDGWSASLAGEKATGHPSSWHAFGDTGEVPSVGQGPAASVGPDVGPPTGAFPVVPRQHIQSSKRAIKQARRRMEAPGWLKALVWMAAVLLAIVLAGTAIWFIKPQWMVNAHLLRIVPAGYNVQHPVAPDHTATTSAGNVAVQLTGSPSATSANYSVAAASFTLNLATTGRCWLQVTSPSSPTPLAEGVQAAGELMHFTSSGPLTVQVGSASVLLSITTGGTSVFDTAPKAAPFTYTFTPAGS